MDTKDEGNIDVVSPPDNFSMVVKVLYKARKIKTVLFLCPEPYPQGILTALGARLIQIGLEGNKEPFVDIPEHLVSKALHHVFDANNHPLLIHCNKGKHRTGCVVGCLRKVQQWAMTAIFEEYRRFSTPKDRFMDQQFIELWDPKPFYEKYCQPNQLFEKKTENKVEFKQLKKKAIEKK